MFNFFDQERIFAFVIITRQTIHNFCFEWEEQYHPLHMKILNTISGWEFVRDWKDKDYKFPIGRAIIMSDRIHQNIEDLKSDFMQSIINKHKKTMSNLYNIIFSIDKGESFFVYRLVYSIPSQTLCLRIKTELEYIDSGKTKGEADEWYEKYADSLFGKYDLIQYVDKKQGETDKTKRVCRFCQRKTPEVTFKKIAHAIPESIGGHRNLICYEECDECNELLGAKVETNLCNWFDFRRSQFGVTKKHGGVSNAYGRNYIIENQNISIFNEKSDNDKTKALGSNPVSLQGIYRSLCKIAINLIENNYLPLLQTTIDWVRFGMPKASKYPRIAQMCHLYPTEKPYLYIFTRKDNIDSENAPLHFCILRIFDLAFLYTIPHVDGRMLFPPSYTANINTEALKVFGLNQRWIWESYDSTEARNPHVELVFSKSTCTSHPLNEKADPNKLRIEKKPVNSVDFNIPKISTRDIVTHAISKVCYDDNLEIKEIIQTVGFVSSECIFDISARCALFLRLIIKFDNVLNNSTVADLTYEICFKPDIYKGQFEYSESSIAVNQDLIIQALDIALDYLFHDIIQQCPNFSFTRENLSLNNVSELLADMNIVIVKDGSPILLTKGISLWYSGYQ